MATYGEYTTITNVRTQYITSSQSGDDQMIMAMIRQVSREIDRMTNRRFYPLIETRQFDTPLYPPGYPYSASKELLSFDTDLLAATTVTNGNGDTIAAAGYVLYPLNVSPKEWMILLPGYIWQPGTTGAGNAALSILGVWGYHDDYASAWVDTTATLAAAITTTSATSLTCTTGKLVAGDLIKIDSEYLYVTAVTTGASDTVTIVRGVNGSTAATHLISVSITRWTVGYELEMLARQAAAAYYRLRSNPGLDSATVDGVTFVSPRDVNAYVRKRLDALGLIRSGIG